jgi:hypothetical protein
MPEQLDKCVSAVMERGIPEDRAWAICKAATGLSENEAEHVSIAVTLAAIPEETWGAARETYTVARERLGASHEDALRKAHDLPRFLGWQHVESVGWVREFQAARTRSVMGVEIFAAGTWTDSGGTTHTWSMEDLAAMVAQQGERVPLKAGHTSDAFNDALAHALNVPKAIITGEGMGQGQIALGKVTNLRVQGDRLIADFQDVPEPVADLIDMQGDSGFTNVSSEIAMGEHGPVLVGVALLGAEDPAVDTLAGLEAALVMAAPGKQVYRFARGAGGALSQADAEADLETVEAKLKDAIKGTKSEGILSRLFSDAKERLRDMFTTKKFHTPEERKNSLRFLAMDLGLEEGASIDDIIARLQEIKGQMNGETVFAKGEAAMFTELREYLGMAADATEEAVLSAVKERLAKHQDDDDDDDEEDEKMKHAAEAAAKFTKELSERDKRIKALEDKNAVLELSQRVASFAKRAEPWKAAGAIEDADAIATDLAGMTDAQAEIAASAFNRAAESLKKASLFTAVSTPRTGNPSGDAEVETEIKRHMDAGKTREAAVAAMATEKPALFRRYQADSMMVRNGREG